MTASERLKALGERYAELLTDKPPRGENYAVNYLGPLANLSSDFVRALPEHVAVVEAAERLSDFLENEKETHEPSEDDLNRGFVALEKSGDYEREEELGVALLHALAALDAKLANE